MNEIENCEDFCDFAQIEQCMVKEKIPFPLTAIIKLKQWADENPEKVRANTNRWRKNNPEKVRDMAKKAYEKIQSDPVKKERHRQNRNAWYRNKYKTDPEWRMKRALQNKIYISNKQNINKGNTLG